MIITKIDAILLQQFLQVVELPPTLSVVRCEFLEEFLDPIANEIATSEQNNDFLKELVPIHVEDKEVFVLIKNILLNSNVLLNGEMALAHYRILKEIDTVLT